MQPNYGQYAQPAPNNVPPNYGGYVVPNAPQFTPPQYAPQQQPAAAPEPSASLPSGDFQDPRAGGGELSPKIRHMVGRTVIIEPLRIDENAKGMAQPGKEAEMRPCLYAHVTIVPGGLDKNGQPLGPIEFGDEWAGGRQKHGNTHQVPAPYRCTNQMINNTWIVNACRDALPPLGNGLMLGVIERGTQGNEPYLLTKVDQFVDGSDRPDGAQRRAAAWQLWQAIKAGQFANPVPTPLAPTPGSAYAQQSYQQAPGYPQAQYGGPVQPGYVPTPYGPAPTTAVHPAYAAAVAPPGVQTYAQPAPPQSAPPAPTAAPGTPAGLPPGFDVTQPPPGWDAGAWAQVTSNGANTAQAAAIWQNIFAQQRPRTTADLNPPVPQNQPGAPAPW